MGGDASTALTMDLRAGERMLIGDVAVELIHKSGQLARLRIVAPQNTSIKKDSGLRAKRD